MGRNSLRKINIETGNWMETRIPLGLGAFICAVKMKLN